MGTPKHCLTENSRGWIKKINGEVRWICSKSVAPTAADADRVYEEKFADLWRPRPALPATERSLYVRDLANLFVDHQARRLASGQITQVSYKEYEDACADFVLSVGDVRVLELTPGDFAAARSEFAKRFTVHRLGKWIILVRSMFRWSQGHPIRLPAPDYGEAFDMPTKRQVRLHRAKVLSKGPQVFTPEECCLLVDMADGAMKAVVLLALNGAMGPHDLCELPWRLIDIKRGWLDYARRKTGIHRRIPLWPETLLAMDGLRKNTAVAVGYTVDGLQANWSRLLTRCGLRRRGIYCLRRTWRTIADEKGDPRAAESIMGHVLDDVGTLYVDHITDSRLIAVSDYVRHRLLGAYVAGTHAASLKAKARAKWLAQLSAARRARKPRPRPK
jgi:hypothetical protein